MNEQEKSKEVLKAEQDVKRAKERLNKAKRKDRAARERERSRHKYMMGGLIAIYFEECFEFTEKEMNRIISYAIKHSDTRRMIEKVVAERPPEGAENGGSDDKGNANSESENS